MVEIFWMIKYFFFIKQFYLLIPNRILSPRMFEIASIVPSEVSMQSQLHSESNFVNFEHLPFVVGSCSYVSDIALSKFLLDQFATKRHRVLCVDLSKCIVSERNKTQNIIISNTWVVLLNTRLVLQEWKTSSWTLSNLHKSPDTIQWIDHL